MRFVPAEDADHPERWRTEPSQEELASMRADIKRQFDCTEDIAEQWHLWRSRRITEEEANRARLAALFTDIPPVTWLGPWRAQAPPPGLTKP